ncbi:hypothetical protein [Solibacillus sp. CAU 1738]|uniref:hypothetical protein n=1 Tax=Solibacillus sp. CAU 1738 TaxID=3140363 RepID=UPI003260830C
MSMWIAIAAISISAILADMFNKNKKIELKRIDKEIDLEKLRLKTYEIETEKMRLELEHSKQALLEIKR